MINAEQMRHIAGKHAYYEPRPIRTDGVEVVNEKTNGINDRVIRLENSNTEILGALVRADQQMRRMSQEIADLRAKLAEYESVVNAEYKLG